VRPLHGAPPVRAGVVRFESYTVETMEVVVLAPVQDFIGTLDPSIRAKAYRLVDLLEEYGRDLTMPNGKPIGQGLWELRSRTRPAIRILYGFCNGQAVLVHALKKQRPALLPRDTELARKRLRTYCA